MIEQATRGNLSKKLTGIAQSGRLGDLNFNCVELGVTDDHEVTVADQTSPKSIIIKIKFTFNME